jgi:HEAT repeat protein
VKVPKVKKKPPRKSPRFSEEMIQDCLQIMESGDIEDLFEIIPRLGVLRDDRFNEPLEALLTHKDVKRREFAAFSMGAIGDRVFLESLKHAFQESQKLKGFGSEEFQIAVIEAIGAIGDDAAAAFFSPILEGSEGGAKARRIRSWIIESLGAIAQQGGTQSLEALLKASHHRDPELRAQSISELSVAHWHKPNHISSAALKRIYQLTEDRSRIVAESALAALQSLADVGCQRAEKYFSEQESGG